MANKTKPSVPGVSPISSITLFLFVLAMALLAGAFYFHEKVVAFRSLGLMGIFLINFLGSATLFLPAPALASVVVGGVVYPPLAVAVLAALGGALGDMLGFLIGHSSKHVLIAKKEHKVYHLLTRLFMQYGAIAILLFAFIPNPFFDFIGIIAGVFSYSPLRFFILLFAGRLLRDLLLAYAGAHI